MKGVAVVEIDFQSPKGDLNSNISIKEDNVFRELNVYAFPRGISSYEFYAKEDFESIKLGTIKLNSDKYIFVSRVFFAGKISKVKGAGIAVERPAWTARAVLIHRDDFNSYGRDILAVRDFLREKRKADEFEDFIKSNSAVFSKEKLTEVVSGVDGDCEFVGKVVDCFAANERVNMYYSDLASAENLLRAVYLFLPLSKIEERTLATDCKDPAVIEREHYVFIRSSSAQPVEEYAVPTLETPTDLPDWVRTAKKTRDKKDERPRFRSEKREEKKEKDLVKVKKGEGLVLLDKQEVTPGRYPEKFQEVVREAVEGVDWSVGWEEKYGLLLESLENVDASGKASIMEASPEIQGIKSSLAPINKLEQNVDSVSDALKGVASLLGSEWYNINLNDKCALFLLYVKNLTDGRMLEPYLNREDIDLGVKTQSRIEEIKKFLDSIKSAETLLKNTEEEVNKVLTSMAKAKEWLGRKQNEFSVYRKSFGFLDSFTGEKGAGENFQKIPAIINGLFRTVETESEKVLNIISRTFTPYEEVIQELNDLVGKTNELDNLSKKLRKAVENSLKVIEESQLGKSTLLTKEEGYIYFLHRLLEPITSQLIAQSKQAQAPILKNLQSIVSRGKKVYTDKLQVWERTISSVEDLDRILQ